MADREVEVIVCLADGSEPVAGRLWSHRRRGVESQTFRYAAEYLGNELAYALDPLLPLVEGPLQTPAGRVTFGAFSDCAPDRWGRRLIARVQAKDSKRHGQAAKSIGEADYLLGVRDDLRQGALRFRELDEFLAPAQSGVPALLDLPRLLNAAERLERDEESEQELADLLRGGSSLGGARPKSHVKTDDGRIAIAKFPSPGADEWDLMRWEAVALTLARRAGVDVPPSKLHEIDGKSVLVIERFDRAGERRIGYASAMTMLGRHNGDRGSYLELAEVIFQHSLTAEADVHQLWRRIAFSVLISNFDDHLRNHGYLRAGAFGWTLSPAFDINPDPRPGERHLHTAIDFDDTNAQIELLLRVAPEFRLSQAQATQVLREVVDATSKWREVAGELAVAPAELALMQPAFEHDAAMQARSLVGA